MKTALMQLMDNIELQIEKEKIEGKFGIGIWGLHQAKNLVIELLEKEKEQIIDAYEDGYEACDLDEVMEVNKKLTSGKLYYNMNYNQNK